MQCKPKILIVGGTGMFGHRLALHLAKTQPRDAQLIITSRSASKAASAAEEISTTFPTCSVEGIAFDRSDDPKRVIDSIKPNVVVDCSGPFQVQNYDLPKVALDCGSHFVDLADARDYIKKFAISLSSLAKKSDKVAITGASSTPALSVNVVATLTEGWREVHQVEIAITPAGSAEVGLSVMQAILGYAGRQISVWKDGKPDSIYGLIGSKDVDIPRLGKRRLVPVETIDAELLGPRYNVNGDVLFYMGLENRMEQFGIEGLAHLVKWGVVGNIKPLAPMLIKVRKLLAPISADKGAMYVVVKGENASGEEEIAKWSVLATKKDGPFIPILPMAAAIKKLLNSSVANGAMSADSFVTLKEIEHEMHTYNMSTRMERC